MAYQVTALGISVLALLREPPMHGYEMFQTSAVRHGDRILKVRPCSMCHVVYRLAEEKLIRRSGTCRDGNRPGRSAAELRALSAPPAGHLRHPAALNYLVATTGAQADWLLRFLDTWRAARDEVRT